MRAFQRSLAGGLTLLMLILFAGCGGGGGGGTVTPDLGDFTVDYGDQMAIYTPGTKAVSTVYAIFADPTGQKDPINYVLYRKNTTTNKWSLDLSSSSTAFNKTAQGEYDLTTYVLTPDQLAATRVGSKYRVTLNIVVTGGGPPDPPF